MTTLKFADSHNMVAFLTKSAESEGFEQIVDFLNANPIRYALTINPTIYASCIKQFWATVKMKTVNGECKKQTMVANSTTEAEYVVASSCCGQVLWIKNQLLDYGYSNEKKLIQMTKIHTEKNVEDLLTKSFD
ncbi:hypothetical protein Tco_0779055, partial [Tanacetum coccineum]